MKKNLTTAEREWMRWGSFVADGKPFRMSVKMWYGKNMTLKYRYVNFLNGDQLKNWLGKNSDDVYEIVNVWNV